MIPHQHENGPLLKNLALFVVYLLAFGLAAAIVYDLFTPGQKPLTPSWQTLSLGTPPLLCDTPVPLAELPLTLTPEMRDVFQEFHSYGSADDAGILITVAVLHLQPAVTAKTESEDMLYIDLQEQFGATDIALASTTSTADSVNTTRIDGTLTIGNKPHAVSKVSHQRGQHIWNVTVLVPADTKDEAAIRKRIMASVKVPAL